MQLVGFTTENPYSKVRVNFKILRREIQQTSNTEALLFISVYS